MGRIAKIIQFVSGTSFEAAASDVKADVGGGDIVTAPHFCQPGDDGVPLPGDFAFFSETPRRGGFASVGYVDPKNPQTALAGERRIYARDAAGEQVCQVWVKSDGTVFADNDKGSYTLDPDGGHTLQNANGFIKLLPDGSVNINGYIISTDGNGTTANGVSQDGHKHAQGADSAGNTQQETEPPTV